MPYLIGTGSEGSFAYYTSGAIRRLSNPELKYLRDEKGVKKIDLDGAATNQAVAVSKALFGI